MIKNNRIDGVTGAKSVVAYALQHCDESLRVSVQVAITESVEHNFSVNVLYTDETETPRILKLPMFQLGGTPIENLTNVTGVGPYTSPELQIRAKANTAVVIQTAGDFTSVKYNVEAAIEGR